MRKAKFKTIVYGETAPEVGSTFEKTDCLIVVQKNEGGTDVDLLYADGNGKVVKATNEQVENADTLLDVVNRGNALEDSQEIVWADSEHTGNTPMSIRASPKSASIFMGLNNFQKYIGNIDESNAWNVSIGTNNYPKFTTGMGNYNLGGKNFEELVEGSNNITLGQFNFSSLTTGSKNTAIGTNNFKGLVVGEGCSTAIGHYNFNKVTKGDDYVSVGNYNFDEFVEGMNNTNVGNYNFRKLTSGKHNTSIGNSNFQKLISGGYNTSIGNFNFIQLEEQSEVGKINEYSTKYPRIMAIGNGLGRNITKATNTIIIGNIFGCGGTVTKELNNKFIVSSAYDAYFGYEFYKEIGVVKKPFNSLSLLYGDFKEQYLEIGGKLRLRPQLNRPQAISENEDDLMLVYTDNDTKPGEVHSIKSTDYILKQIKAMTDEQKQELKTALGIA